MEMYQDYARMMGYEIVFTGIGMAYITIGHVQLTEIMDKENAEIELGMLGMAAMIDTIRKG